jgi:hypothetical protein
MKFVDVPVVGGHSGVTILPLLSKVSYYEICKSCIAGREQIEQIVTTTGWSKLMEVTTLDCVQTIRVLPFCRSPLRCVAWKSDILAVKIHVQICWAFKPVFDCSLYTECCEGVECLPVLRQLQ